MELTARLYLVDYCQSMAANTGWIAIWQGNQTGGYAASTLHLPRSKSAWPSSPAASGSCRGGPCPHRHRPLVSASDGAARRIVPSEFASRRLQDELILSTGQKELTPMKGRIYALGDDSMAPLGQCDLSRKWDADRFRRAVPRSDAQLNLGIENVQ